MAEYLVMVKVEGTGHVKVCAESEAQAIEDAKQMAIEDVEWDIYTATVLHSEKSSS